MSMYHSPGVKYENLTIADDGRLWPYASNKYFVLFEKSQSTKFYDRMVWST